MYKLKKDDLNQFFEYLAGIGTVWGPTKKGKDFVFDPIYRFDQLDLTYLRTIIPIKKLFFPKKQKLFEYNLDEDLSISRGNDIELLDQKIVLGLHPCEINALNLQDDFFMNGMYKDPYYTMLRERTIIIGYSCIPDEHCMCNNTNTSDATKGFDLFLNELQTCYLVWVSSAKGDELIQKNQDIFTDEITRNDQDEFITWNENRNLQFKHKYDDIFPNMPKLMELRYDDEFWDELGEECLSCGTCSLVCPTCNCFNIVDTLEVDQSVGARVREWDSCMYPQYSEVAGGVDFRPTRASRLKLFYTHKLDSYKGLVDYPACVGCGRCDQCPADINIKRVVNKLKEVKL